MTIHSTVDDVRVEKQQFDVSIDKGLLDALLCGDGFDIQYTTIYEWNK